MPDSPKEQLEFTWKVHSYTNEYIRFADQKAGIILAVQSGLIAAMFAAKLHQPCSLSRLNFQDARLAETLTGAVCLLGFLGLLLGAGFAVWAIVPRLWTQFRASLRERLLGLLSGTPKGAIYWKQVLAQANSDAYRETLEGMDERQRLGAVADHVFTLASVVDAKFGWINISVAFGAVGAGFAVIALYFGQV